MFGGVSARGMVNAGRWVRKFDFCLGNVTDLTDLTDIWEFRATSRESGWTCKANIKYQFAVSLD